MIRDIFNVCVALVLSARARQIFGRILWRYKARVEIAALVAIAAVVVMLAPVGYHEGAPAHHEAVTAIAPGADGQVLTAGGDGAPVWSGSWTSGPLNVSNGGTSMILAYNRCSINEAVPAWAATLPAGTIVTLSSTNRACSVQ